MEHHLLLNRETMVNIIRTDDIFYYRNERDNESIERTAKLDLELLTLLEKMSQKEMLNCVIDALKRQSDSIV